MKKTLLGAAIALLSSSAVYAQDYQFEVGAVYMTGDTFGVDYDGFGLNAELHLDTVDTTKGPLNEAAFLDKSSYANLSWATAELDVPGAESADTVAISGRFVTQANLIVEANYIDTDADSAMGLGIGTYINETMDVVVSYQTADKADSSTLSVDLHGVNALEGETAVAFDLGLAYLDVGPETGHGITAGADYYFNKAFSVGAGLTLQSAGDADISTIDIRADYFVTPVARIGFGVTTLGQDGDGQTVQLNAAMRF